MLLLHIFVLCNKYQTSYTAVLLFYIVDIPKYTALFKNIFDLFISIANNYSQKCLLHDSLVFTLNNSFSLQLLQVWYLCGFSHFPYFVLKITFFINLKKRFWKLFFALFPSSVLISLYDLNTWLFAHFALTYDLMPVLNFFLFFIMQFCYMFLCFQVERVNHCQSYVNFQDIEHQFQDNIPHHNHHYSLLWNIKWIAVFVQPI